MLKEIRSGQVSLLIQLNNWRKSGQDNDVILASSITAINAEASFLPLTYLIVLPSLKADLNSGEGRQHRSASYSSATYAERMISTVYIYMP